MPDVAQLAERQRADLAAVTSLMARSALTHLCVSTKDGVDFDFDEPLMIEKRETSTKVQAERTEANRPP